jgi:type IV secretory pathway VirB4 component
MCQLVTLKYQQYDGLSTVMPSGVKRINTKRTLTTESLAVFMPFKVQEIQDTQGVYYGKNVISKNMILIDRKQLQNGNSFILGVSGSGKSFTAKQEITSIALREPDADIIVLDPEAEYKSLIKELGGEVIKISATSDNHINALDMNKDYDDNKPLIAKAEFILSFCEQILKGLTPNQEAIIDRCTTEVYKYYEQGNFQGTPPTLNDFREVLLKQEEKEAKEIALGLELFTKGSLNTFAKQTNVETNNRIICYDIKDLGKQLLPIGMLVILDSFLNRITRNRKSGKRTYIFIDEIYLLFKYNNTATFITELWKRIRKYGGCATAITQNIQDILKRDNSSTMFSNSELIIMLNQSATDREELARCLKMSDMEKGYITNVNSGEGLIRVRNSLIPFKNKFPKDTKLYKLMTTKIEETTGEV